MTEEEQLIQNGNNAEALLGTEAFNQTIKLQVDTAFTAFMNTQMSEEKFREQQYYMYRALVDLINTLKQSVSVRDEINTRIIGDNRQEEE